MTQNSNLPRSQEFYVTQVSEEIKGRVISKLSQEFSRTENRILGALSRLDDFFMSPLIQGYSGTAPETSRNAYGTNQGTNDDDSQSDPHPEASIFQSQMTQNFGPENGIVRADNCWSHLKQLQSVLIFSETALNIRDFCFVQFPSAQDSFWNFSPKYLSITFPGLLYLIANQQKLDLILFNQFLQESWGLTVSGNSNLLIFLQKIDFIVSLPFSSGNLRY